MRRAVLAAAILGLACASHGSEAASELSPAPTPVPPPATLRPTITAREQYYDIDGSSAGALRDQIRRLGPKDTSGEPRDALTVWNLEWSYRESPAPSGASCGLREVHVTLDLETTFPRWKPPSTVAASVMDAWRTYLTHVKEHEAGHRRIAEQNARDLMSALTALRGPTCREVWDEAGRLAERIVAEGRAKNRAYDVETKHGQTQGVVLGP